MEVLRMQIKVGFVFFFFAKYHILILSVKNLYENNFYLQVKQDRKKLDLWMLLKSYFCILHLIMYHQ